MQFLFVLIVAVGASSNTNPSSPHRSGHLRASSWNPLGVVDCRDTRIGCGGGLGGRKILGHPRHIQLSTIHEDSPLDDHAAASSLATIHEEADPFRREIST